MLTSACRATGTARWRSAASTTYTFTDGRYDDATGSHRPKWHQVTLMTDYALSKCTDVYAETVYQHAFGVPSGATLGFANVTGLAASSTRTQVVATVGIRHRF
ncbi:hypothetical protein [Burkholderia sp. AU45388]|uniref:hypothetical protein n=1 Tax=Burkholderia sp. AU45388 TaxID=3059206 RepID=UPI00264D03AF|nr:hypothetical protein [Burkholderia sp. AU45388]MDN7427588.1 hypothetical protein [Burkholderia sp. AU45388]